MKKEYVNPQLEVVKIQQSQLLAGSGQAASNVNNSEDIVWENDGVADSSDDR